MPSAPAQPPAAPPALSADRLVDLYHQMWRIRLLETSVVDLYKKGLVRGSAHPYSGMEAIAVGACAALSADDYVTSTHRGHGHCLAKGLDPKRMLAEILGKAPGYCKGKGGSMHVTSPEHGLLGADGVVAGSTAIAAGAALGARILGRRAVVLCFFGDGAANQGVLFESLNLASVQRLPVVYICENNLWALSTPTSVALSVPDVALRGPGFGMPGVVVDGQDVFAVYGAVAAAVARARAGGGAQPAGVQVVPLPHPFGVRHPGAAPYRRDRHLEGARPDRPARHRPGGPRRCTGGPGRGRSGRARAPGGRRQLRRRRPRRRPRRKPDRRLRPVAPPGGGDRVNAPANAAVDGTGRELTLSQALNEALLQEMRRDPAVFVMGEDVGASEGLFGVTRGLQNEFGAGRVIDAPISEAGFVGAGVGAALVGARPVIEIQVMDFLSLAMDQLANHAAKLRYMTGGLLSVPLVVRGPAATGIGLAAQHSQSLEAWVAHIPGLKVVMPSTPYDAKGLLTSAIRDDNPVVFFEKRLLYATLGPVPEDDYLVPLGQAVVRREGSDLTLVGSGLSAHYALEAAATLAAAGIAAEVIDLRTLVPLDVATIVRSVRKTGRVVVANDGYRTCGFAAEVATRIMEEGFDYLDAPVVRVTCQDAPIPYAEPLEQQVIVSAARIVAAARQLAAPRPVLVAAGAR